MLSLSSSSQSSSTEETELIVRLRFLYLRSYESGRGCMLSALGKRCSRPASPYDGFSRSVKIRPCVELTHLMGAKENIAKLEAIFSPF